MKLIGSLTSPYVRKVRIVLAEKKIDAEFLIDSPWVEGNNISQLNPLGKVPVLVLDDETTLFDSRVIVEYLDNAAPNNRLIPQANRERIAVRRWEALADGVSDAAAAAFLEAKRPDNERSNSWIGRQRQKVALGLAEMERELGENAWCHGNSFSLADIAVACSLGYLNLRFADLNWAEQHPALAKLYEKLMQRPSLIDTVPQG